MIYISIQTVPICQYIIEKYQRGEWQSVDENKREMINELSNRGESEVWNSHDLPIGCTRCLQRAGLWLYLENT